jgi:hypothetical protein
MSLNVMVLESENGAADEARVSVTRRIGGLRVRIAGLDNLTRQERRTAVVRIVGALRQLDRDARTIDVVVDETV